MDVEQMRTVTAPNNSKASFLKFEDKDTIWKLSISINEAASMSGLGRSSIYEAMVSGKLKAKKSGKRTIILVRDLNDFLAALPAANFGPPSN